MFATKKNKKTVAAYDGIHGLLLSVIIMGKQGLLRFLGEGNQQVHHSTFLSHLYLEVTQYLRFR